jgi:non-ribosomal peptide synthetase component E (peptide arylation enzyme)
LVTIQDDAGSPTTLGTFSIGAGASLFVEKNPTDEIFAANAEVKITPVAMVP